MRQVRERAHVHVDLLEFALQGHVAEGPVDAEAGVVHQQPDVAAADARGSGGSTLASGQVGWERLAVDAMSRLQLGGQPLKAVGAACNKHEVVALRRELTRELLADARGGAGDEGELAARGARLRLLAAGLRYGAGHCAPPSAPACGSALVVDGNGVAGADERAGGMRLVYHLVGGDIALPHADKDVVGPCLRDLLHGGLDA